MNQAGLQSRINKIQALLAQFHWKWIGFLLGLGLLLTLSTFLARYCVGAPAFQQTFPWTVLDKDDLAVVQSVAANVGTTFLTAGLLALFEPLLRKTVRAEAKSAASEVIAPVEKGLKKRLSSLEQQVAAAVESDIESQENAIKEATDNFTYSTMLALMLEASKVRALHDDLIVVHAADPPDDLTLTFALREHEKTYDHQPIGTSYSLILSANLTQAPRMDEPEQIWGPDQDFSQVAHALILELAKEGHGIRSDINWDLVTTRIVATLATAIRSWRRDPESTKLQGRLIEVIADKWFITDAGLEAPTFELLIDAADWPPIRMNGRFGPKRRSPVQKPKDADQVEWDLVLNRCDGHFARLLDASGNPIAER